MVLPGQWAHCCQKKGGSAWRRMPRMWRDADRDREWEGVRCKVPGLAETTAFAKPDTVVTNCADSYASFLSVILGSPSSCLVCRMSVRQRLKFYFLECDCVNRAVTRMARIHILGAGTQVPGAGRIGAHGPGAACSGLR